MSPESGAARRLPAPAPDPARTDAAPPSAEEPGRQQPLSALLMALLEDPGRARIAIGDLLVLLEGRGAAALLLLFALPNVLPAPPGTSGILGVPLVYLSLQLMLGRVPWLPRLVADRSLARGDFAALMLRVRPVLARAERLLRPRLPLMTGPGALRLTGAICLGLSIILLLPIPLGNMLPAFAICLMAWGVLERDGLCILVGMLAAALSVLIVWGVILAMLKAAAFVLTRGFG